MKRIALAGITMIALAVLCAGCAGNYNITTTSGHVMTARGKPHYDKANECFDYTDARGEKRTVPAGSVRLIAPASEKENTTGFNPRLAR